MKKISIVLMLLSSLLLSSWSCTRLLGPTGPTVPPPAPTATMTSTPVCVSGSAVTVQSLSALPLTGTASVAVIRSLSDWNAFWVGTPAPPALPAVDFTTQMLLLQRFAACGQYTIDQVCNSNGAWTVSETAPSTFPYPCDPIADLCQSLTLSASASPVTILLSYNLTYPVVTPVVIVMLTPPPTPIATPTPVPVIVPTPYVTVVP